MRHRSVQLNQNWNKPGHALNRREFIKSAGIALGALAFPWSGQQHQHSSLVEFPRFERLARISEGKQELKARPDLESQTLGVVYEDYVLPWLREVSASRPAYIFNNQRWVETPQGFLYTPYVQPVYNLPNQPINELQQTSLGSGMWAQVTVPYVDAYLDGEASSNSWVSARQEQGMPFRFYYSQVFWVDRIRKNDLGQVQYRVNPNYYGGIDRLWAAGEAFRPITPDDLAPIHPDVKDKRIEVNITQQTLSCFEGDQEVFFCRVATGARFDMYGNIVENWSTPVGAHRVTRKFVSLQMSGGTTGAPYDIPGIGWTSIFATGGVAIHSTFWHNKFGDPVSHGCVNVPPQAAQWIFRWTEPFVSYDPGMLDVTVTGQASTPVQVVEA